MHFKVETPKHPNLARYPSTDYDLAVKFSKLMHEELGDFLKAAILFGSTARGERPLYNERDIDILLVINDVTTVTSDEVIQAYRVITENVSMRVSRRLHITTLKLTTFWDYVRNGDPVAINMLRDGVPLFDSGFFEPAQQLLYQGRIRPSRESIWTYFARAPATLVNADWHILQATLDLYWAVVDSAHAALMHLGEVPPTPAHVSELIEKKMVRHGLVSQKYADMMARFYTLQKKITHREIQTIPGKDFDNHRRDAAEFVKAMQEVVEREHR